MYRYMNRYRSNRTPGRRCQERSVVLTIPVILSQLFIGKDYIRHTEHFQCRERVLFVTFVEPDPFYSYMIEDLLSGQ